MPLKFIFSVGFLVMFVDAYKILVYSPKLGPSQVKFMGKIADILVRAGNDVVVYSPIIERNTRINGTDLARVILREKDFESIEFGGEEFQKHAWESRPSNFWDQYMAYIPISETYGSSCQRKILFSDQKFLGQLNDDKLMSSLKSEKFDIALGENFDNCYYGVLKRLGVENYITLSSMGSMENVMMDLGIPSTPSFLPSQFGYLTPPYSYFERSINLMNFALAYFYGHRVFGGGPIDVMTENFGLAFNIHDMISKSAYYFINVDEHVDFPMPISHKVVFIGGIGRVQSKPLPKDLENIFTQTKRGVILISFGSNAQSHAMPDQIKKMFLDTFKKFPDVNFIWKYEKDEHKISDGIPNVFTRKWLPQNDILDHPKLLAFISHGGMNSVQEGSSKGIPMIVIPLFADQFINAKMLETKNTAIVLSLKELTVEKLSNSIRKIIDDDKYRTNARRLAEMMASKPMSAEERVVKYTEFAAKYGPDLNFDMEGRYLSYVEYYCLDIIIPFFILVGLILYLASRLFVKFLMHLVTSIVKKPKIE